MRLLKTLFIILLFTLELSAQSNLCDQGKFYVAGTFPKNIYGFTISGASITPVDTIANPYSVSLAIGKNLATPLNGNTFYAEQNATVIRMENNSWTSTGVSYSKQIHNAGAFDTLIFYTTTAGSALGRQILRFDGSTITSIYFSIQRSLAVADIVVDKEGFVWFISSSDSTQAGIADTLNRMSATGQIVNQFSLNLNVGNGYGMFLLDDTFYIGIGPGNTLHPNTLIPLNIVQDSVIVGDPIPFNSSNFTDMASCSPGLPLSTRQFVKKEEWFLFPNPASKSFTVNLAKDIIESITVYSLQGELLCSVNPFTSTYMISLIGIPSGVKVVEIKTSKATFRKKLVTIE